MKGKGRQTGKGTSEDNDECLSWLLPSTQVTLKIPWMCWEINSLVSQWDTGKAKIKTVTQIIIRDRACLQDSFDLK